MHSESTSSRKPWLNTIKHGHHMVEWPFRVRLWELIVGQFPGSQILCRIYTPQKSFGPMCKRMQEARVRWICISRRLGNVTLFQLAFLWKSDPNFPCEKSQWANTVVKIKWLIFNYQHPFNCWVICRRVPRLSTTKLQSSYLREGERRGEGDRFDCWNQCLYTYCMCYLSYVM